MTSNLRAPANDRRLASLLDSVAESCAHVLGEHDPGDLRDSLRLCDERAPGTWLPLMIREYLEVWK